MEIFGTFVSNVSYVCDRECVCNTSVPDSSCTFHESFIPHSLTYLPLPDPCRVIPDRRLPPLQPTKIPSLPRFEYSHPFTPSGPESVKGNVVITSEVESKHRRKTEQVTESKGLDVSPSRIWARYKSLQRHLNFIPLTDRQTSPLFYSPITESTIRRSCHYWVTRDLWYRPV